VRRRVDLVNRLVAAAPDDHTVEHDDRANRYLVAVPRRAGLDNRLAHEPFVVRAVSRSHRNRLSIS